jgi:hypothetical protein
MAATTTDEAVKATPPLTQAERALAAAGHADRAHHLLIEADAAMATISPGRVSDVLVHRVELAEAHANVALALSSLVVPTMPAPPAPKE